MTVCFFCFSSRMMNLNASAYLVPSLKMCPTSMPRFASSLADASRGEGSPATALRISPTRIRPDCLPCSGRSASRSRAPVETGDVVVLLVSAGGPCAGRRVRVDHQERVVSAFDHLRADVTDGKAGFLRLLLVGDFNREPERVADLALVDVVVTAHRGEHILPLLAPNFLEHDRLEHLLGLDA